MLGALTVVDFVSVVDLLVVHVELCFESVFAFVAPIPPIPFVDMLVLVEVLDTLAFAPFVALLAAFVCASLLTVVPLLRVRAATAATAGFEPNGFRASGFGGAAAAGTNGFRPACCDALTGCGFVGCAFCVQFERPERPDGPEGA